MKNKILLFIAGIITLSGCSFFNSSSSQGTGAGPDNSEVVEYEHFEFESREEMEIFYEILDQEQIELENVIENLIDSETISFEIKVSNTLKEEIPDFLPSELYEYNINWKEVLSKYVIGSSVIILAGVLHLSTMGTGVAYIFASSFYGSVNQAFSGALLGAIINTAIQGITTGDFSKEAVLKYAVEASADGFMWGAITGAVMGLFTATPPNFTDEIKPLKQAGRYRKTNGSFTIKNNEVSYLGKRIGYVDDFGNVIGTGSYDGILLEGQKLFSVDELGQIGNYNFRAIQQGFTFDASGNLLNVIKYDKALYLPNGAFEIASITKGGVINGKIISYTDYKGVTREFLVSAKDGRLHSILNNGTFSTIDDWNRLIANLAGNGVTTAKAGIIEAVRTGKMSPSQLQTYVSLSDDARTMYSYNSLWSYLKTNGKFPPEIAWEGHHINSVVNSPWLANNPNNIRMVDKFQHKIEHNFNFQNLTNGMLTNLLSLLGIA